MLRRASERELTSLLGEMDVPDMRRDVSKPDNVAWLLRNLRVRNDDHPRIDEAMSMLKALMRAKRAAGVPKKYEHIDFTPPESAAKAAEKGLEYREKASPSNKGGLTVSEASKEGIGSGVQRAVNLKNRNTLSPDTIKQMHGFFSRHEQNKGVAPEHKSEPWNDKGNVSWLLWGGDAAKSWVEKVLGQMETADEKEKAKAVKKAAWALAASTHEKSLALAKYLGQFAKREGVGQHVYVVGGAVRNFLLNQPIKDIDVVVDSVALRGYDSEKFARNLARVLPAATSLVTNQYGVAILTVKGPWVLDGHDMQGEVIEIANARNESYGKTEGKGYKPSGVNPATIEEDVYRREFTFNTLLWRLNDLVHGPERAEIIDLTGCGRSDLERRVMRCPRDPDVVFSDDPTRMLRALKFAVKYGFDVPPDLQAAIKRNAAKLAGVPHEAVGTLLVRDIFGTPRAREMLRFMEKLGLLDVIRDMVAKNKGFATYLSGQLSAHDAAFLLDMDDLNMGVRLPLNFLAPAQRVRVRDLLDSLPSDEAQAFVAALTRPVLDNNALITQFSLKPHERGLLQPLAREALLDDPTLAARPQELTSEVARRMEQTRVRTASVNWNGTEVGSGRGRKASLDTVTYGNLTVEEEAEALSLSEVFNSNVLEQMPHRPFPANTSPETKAELAYLMRLQNTVRPYSAARVRLTDENSTETLEAYCSAHGLCTGGVLEVAQAARPVLLQLKRLYNRPRPYQVAAYMEPGFHPLSSTSVHTPAYPSGHSAQAVLAALLLSDMHPAHREAFMALAKEVGQHRMVGGFHFPSDVAYGEEVGRVLYGCLARASVRTAAAKYKDKKQVPKADGSGKTTVYVYSERQVANRQREKAERLEDFKPALADLRAQVKKDLDSDDPKKGLIALAVGLIDATYERVGNDESADKGHYGVTGWLRKHVTFKGNRAVIRYVGKSGVKHEKSVDDEVLVGALKDCCGNKDGEQQVLSLGKHAVSSDDVNEYLKPYGITAKDLRGLHANREMQERLRAIRSKGPKLPRLRKERDPILKDEFKEALEAAAEAVGHEPATLRKQYLVPGLEEAYMKDGTVPRDLTASTRVASLYLRATKSDAEREDEEAERLIKPEPKYKPPRGDLRRRRVETEGDADPDKAQDDKDRSQNYKDAAVRSAVQVATAAWLFKTAREAPPSEKSDKPSAEGSGKGDTSALQAQAKKEFEAYEKAHPDTELDASDFLKRLQEKAKRKAEKIRDGEDGEDDGGDDESADTKHFEQQEKDRKAKRVGQLVEKVGRDWDATKGSLPLSDENRNRISSAIAKYTPAQRAEFAAAFSSAREQAIADYTDKGYNSESVEAAILSMGTKIKSTDPKKIAAHAAKAIFADRVLLNPMLLTPDEPLSDEDEEGTADTAKATERVGQAMTRFTNASKRERELMSKRIDEAIAEAPQGSAKHEDLLAVKFSLDVTNALRANERDDDADDEDDDGKEKPLKPPKGMSKVQFGLLQHFSGDPEKSSELLGLSFRASRKDKTATEDTRKFVREATGSMKPEQINALLPEEMQSVSLAVKGWLKEIASDRADSLKSRGKSTKKEDAEIAEYDARMKEIGERLGERLSDVVAETIDRKVDPKKTKELATGIEGLSEAYKSGGATKSGKGSDKDFFARLQAMFKKFLGKGGASPRSATASLALPRYGFPLR